MKKKLLGLALVLFIMALFMPCIHAAEIVDSGVCGAEGANVTWTLDSDGVVDIVGNGATRYYLNDSQWGGYSPFWNNDNVKKVVVHENITNIGDGMFEYCKNLESVILPYGIESIDGSAFAYDEKLYDITLPDSILNIGSGAFHYTAIYNDSSNWQDGALYIDNYLVETNSDLPNSYTVKDGTIAIGGYALAYHSSMTDITLPDSVLAIGDDAFSGCSQLKNISLPDSLVEIGEDVFSSTAFYKDEQNWEDGSLYIDNYLIEVSSDMTGVYSIKEGTKAIADSAFHGPYSWLSGITEIRIPDSVTKISDGLFSPLNSLEKIYIDNEYYTSVDGVLFNKDKTELIVYPKSRKGKLYIIPDGTEIIHDSALPSYQNLEDLYIPVSLKTVRESNYGFTNVYYGGSEEDYKNINIVGILDEHFGGLGRMPLFADNIYYNITSMNPPEIVGEPTVIASDDGYVVTVQLDSTNYKSTIIAVTYNNGAMTGMSTETISPNDTEKILKISAESADSAKVFIWDSLNGMKPLCNAETVMVNAE